MHGWDEEYILDDRAVRHGGAGVTGFFSGEPVSETEVNEDNDEDNLDPSVSENQQNAPQLDHDFQTFQPHKQSPAQVPSRCAAATRLIA